MGFRKAVGFSRPMSPRGVHRSDTEKSACEAWKPFFFLISTGKTVRILVKTFFFCFGDHFIVSTGKTVKISVKTFFFCFWRSHHNSDKTAAFSPSVLELTKPEIRHIWAGPGPTFSSRRPWLLAILNGLKSARSFEKSPFCDVTNSLKSARNFEKSPLLWCHKITKCRVANGMDYGVERIKLYFRE